MKFCPECGTSLLSGSVNYCHKCGSALWKESKDKDDLSLGEQVSTSNHSIYSLGVKLEQMVEQILRNNLL